MACLSRNGCYRSAFNILVSVSNGRELCVSKKLDEKTTDSLQVSNQEILEVIVGGLWFVVHVSIPLFKA